MGSVLELPRKSVISERMRADSFMFEEECEFTKTETNAVVECFMQEKFKKIMRLDGINDEEISKSLSY